MKSKYRNLFLLFGIVAIAVMLLTFDVSYAELTDSLRKAGLCFPVVIFLWVLIYLLNAGAWYIIIHDGFRGDKIPYWRVYKYTVTGFALNATTPVGLMGGEPYRIMELAPYVGVEKATSSVILYVMMHIFLTFVLAFLYPSLSRFILSSPSMESVIVFGIFRHLLFNGSLFLYERLSAGVDDALYPIVAKGVFFEALGYKFC